MLSDQVIVQRLVMKAEDSISHRRVHMSSGKPMIEFLSIVTLINRGSVKGRPT